METDAASLDQARNSGKKWFPFKKGGQFRRWYGNNESVLNWKDDGKEIKAAVVDNPGDPNTTHWSRRIFGVEYFFKPGLTWTKISSFKLSVRRHGPGFIFSDASNGAFPSEDAELFLALLNSNVVGELMKIVSPTMNCKAGDIARLPVISVEGPPKNEIVSNTRSLIRLVNSDWDSSEVSWEFSTSPLLAPQYKDHLISATLDRVRSAWLTATTAVRELEQRNNRIFIDAYGLQDELSPGVPLSEITLTCNPHYRYGGKRSEEELERLLRADTMREFISYAVGCMFGRYSLDKPGLILANQGETLNDYLRQVPNPSFMPDRDNVIPVLDGEWFADDIAARFGRFLRVTFGDEHYAENLKFIQDAIGRDIRSFFVREFYDDHLKRYQKRPIYWLFSSPGGSFNALVYMHRYRPDTVSVVLNDYLREYQVKLAAARAEALHNSIAAGASNREKTAALKEVGRLDKVLQELADYETVLLELARKQVALDLDDGVKVNYAKLGPALRRVAGLNA
jgi:hypothetical protein